MNSDEVAEAEPIACGHTGLWARSGIPHRGWTCTDIEDLEDDREICEMCESTEIRYAHIMSHPDYPEPLRVGCICAGHMEGDYTVARLREAELRNLVFRRNNWLSRKWRKSFYGNEYLNVGEFNIVVYAKGRAWGVMIKHRRTGQGVKSDDPYPTCEAAKLAGFDQMIKMKGTV